MKLEDVLGDWVGERCTVRIERDAVHLTEPGLRPSSVTGATVTSADGELSFRSPVGRDVDVVLERTESGKVQLMWIDDGPFPGVYDLERPEIVRDYPCGDNRVLFAIQYAEQIVRKHGQHFYDHTKGLRRYGDLKVEENEAIRLSGHYPGQTPRYESWLQERRAVERLNACWAAIREICRAGRVAIYPGTSVHQFDLAWCHLDNPAPYMMFTDDLAEAEHIQFVSMSDLAHQMSIDELDADLNRVVGLPDVRYLDLAANESASHRVRAFPYDSLSSLETVDLSSNDLPALPMGLAVNESVQLLSVARNAFEEAPDLSGMKSLRWLDLTGNPLPKDEVADLRAEYPDLKLWV